MIKLEEEHGDMTGPARHSSSCLTSCTRLYFLSSPPPPMFLINKQIGRMPVTEAPVTGAVPVTCYQLWTNKSSKGAIEDYSNILYETFFYVLNTELVVVQHLTSLTLSVATKRLWTNMWRTTFSLPQNTNYFMFMLTHKCLAYMCFFQCQSQQLQD